MKITLFVVATGKYFQFLEQLLQSADQFFLSGHEKEFIVFTDNTNFNLSSFLPDCKTAIHFFHTKHEPWPFSTLKRYHHYANWLKKNKGQSDYVFAIDADAKFTGPVGDEILKDTVGVLHCGHITDTPDKFPAGLSSWEHYFGGGFVGGSEKAFYILSKGISIEADHLIIEDKIPQFHDETILNGFLNSTHWKNSVTALNCSYHYPLWHDGNLLPHIAQNWQEHGLSFEPKICFLHKNHQELRSVEPVTDNQ